MASFPMWPNSAILINQNETCKMLAGSPIFWYLHYLQKDNIVDNIQKTPDVNEISDFSTRILDDVPFHKIFWDGLDEDMNDHWQWSVLKS